MADVPPNGNAGAALAADPKPNRSEHIITLSQIQIFLLVCVAGAVGTLVSWTLGLDADVARYRWYQVLVAGAAAAAIMIFYLARTDTRNLIYATCFALLCGMVGPTVLQKAVKDFKEGIEAGNKVKEDAKTAGEKVNTPPTTPDAVKDAETQANKLIASTQTAVEKDAPKADVQSGKEAVETIASKLQQTVETPNISAETKQKAAEALERIGENAEQANLPKVAKKVEEGRRSEAVAATLISKLASADGQIDETVQKQITEIRQPAVKPLLAEVARRGSSPVDDNLRLAAARALSKMKQPISLSADEVGTVVSLLSVADSPTRLAAAEFLMNLEDQQTIHYAFSELCKIVKNPGNPDDKIQGSRVYNTAIILGTWARNLKPGIRAPADAGGQRASMAQAALDEAKHLDQLLKKKGANKWKHTIADLEDLIRKAEAKQAEQPGNLPAGVREDRDQNSRALASSAVR